MSFEIVLGCNPLPGQEEAAADLVLQMVSELGGRSIKAQAYELETSREQSEAGRPFRFTLIARGEDDPRPTLKSMLAEPAFQPGFRLFGLRPVSGLRQAEASSLPGPDLLQVCARSLQGRDAQFETFYNDTHFDELLAVPGFASGQLFIVEDDHSQPEDEPHRYVSLWQVTDHASAGVELAKRRGTPALTPNVEADRSVMDSAFYRGLGIPS